MFKQIRTRRVAKQLKNKVVLIEYVYAKKGEAETRHHELKNGAVVTADAKKGVTVIEQGTGKRLQFPPDFSAWQPIRKMSYMNPKTAEIVRNAEFKSLWIVDLDTQQMTRGHSSYQSKKSGTFSIYGIGTHLYGHTPTEDGAYITTKWVVFVLVPIFPLASFRIMKPPTSSPTLGMTHTRHVAFAMPLNHSQVLKGYAYTLAAAVVIGLTFIHPLG